MQTSKPGAWIFAHFHLFTSVKMKENLPARIALAPFRSSCIPN